MDSDAQLAFGGISRSKCNPLVMSREKYLAQGVFVGKFSNGRMIFHWADVQGALCLGMFAGNFWRRVNFLRGDVVGKVCSCLRAELQVSEQQL